MNKDRNRVCPVELANSLDNKIRKWVQSPNKILSPYIKEGMRVLDIGCGPGFFSIELAKLVGNSGKVFSADLQEGMLQKLKDKIQGTELEKRITLIKSEKSELKVKENVDFILAFYMVHEIHDKNLFFQECKNILKSDGQFLIVEPKIFHVSKKGFEVTMEYAKNNGFFIHPSPKLFLSWSAILKNA
jgi:ubiquinone/menaquinone biosynthesis C-methylase UbiE